MTSIYNNPANIEKGQGYAGETEETYANDRLDKGLKPFAVFDSPQMGIRALMRDLQTKVKRHGGNIDKIMSQFAPPFENDTATYADIIKSQIGKDICTVDDIPEIAKAIIKVESPKLKDYYLQEDVFNEAITLSKHDLPSSYDLQKARGFMNETEGSN